MRHTLPTGCWDGPNTAMLRTLTAYYENAHPQSGPPTHVQCYQAMQAWCRAGHKKKADMPDKGTVMMPLRLNSCFTTGPRTTRLTLPWKGSMQPLRLAWRSTDARTDMLTAEGNSLSSIT